MGGVTTGGRMDSRAHSPGPDGTHKKQCERDWGFETRPRHSSRSGHSLSVTTTRPRERARDTSRWTSTMATDDQQMAGWESISFLHYTTEGIPVSGDPAFRPPLEPPRPQATVPGRRRAGLEWEFSLTVSGNSQISARNRGSGKIVWPGLALGGWTLPDANALYREERAAGLFPLACNWAGWRK